MKYWQYKLMKPIFSWRNKYLKYLAKKESQELDLFNKAVLEISEYTNESTEVVREKHHLGPRSEKTFSIFENQKNLTVDTVEGFYKEAHYYLYELPLWNAQRARPRHLYRVMEPYLKKFKCQKVLDFGGGTGDLCLELGERKLDASYCDIGEDVSKFAEWRFKRRNLNIPIYHSLDELKGQTFDAVISFDCFEHIKDLGRVIEQLVALIRSDGLLISAEAFEGGGLHLLENQKYHDEKEFDNLLSGYGLEFTGRIAQYIFYKKVD